MILKNNRYYKMDTPINTVHNIRKILYKIKCLPYETSWDNPHKELYSTRIKTGIDCGFWGTNGKGRSKDFALASAYAEFIERLQNKVLLSSLQKKFYHEIKNQTSIYIYPDEMFLTIEEFNNLPSDIIHMIKHNIRINIKKYFDRLISNNFSGCLSVPFFDTFRSKVVYLPYKLLISLTGSNGMAAGNTKIEAIYQALCEILERYAASIIYYNQITPPTIGIQYIKTNYQKEYNIIRNIEEEKGYKVTIKDFSLNSNLPVLGVIICDTKNKKYRLNVGSDLNFQVALSRCLTEVYQGIHDEKTMKEIMVAIPLNEHSYFLNDDKKSIAKRESELTKFSKDGSGVFPKSLFAEKADYEVNHRAFSCKKSFKEDVTYLLNLIKISFDCNVYIRDVSFLGFPSVYVVIPEMSHLGKKQISIFNQKEIRIEYDNIQDLFFPFDKINMERLKQLVEIIKNFPDMPLSILLKLEFEYKSIWNSLEVSFFLTLAYYKLRKFDKSLEYLERFLKESKNKNKDYNEYYTIAKHYIKLKLDNKTNDEIKKELCKQLSNKTIINEIIHDLENPDNVFKHFTYPNCPDCLNCSLSKHCITRHKIEFTKIINAEMLNRQVNQMQIKDIL